MGSSALNYSSQRNDRIAFPCLGKCLGDYRQFVGPRHANKNKIPLAATMPYKRVNGSLD